ncbi:MAG: DUF2846 domain-containing protein [Sphingomonadaceae bacterium]|nr:DUF2846 domain-containing protein [Sphingomonadaceae bacterium]
MKNAFWIVVIVIAAIIGAMYGPSLLETFPPEVVLIGGGLFFLALIGFVIFSLSGNKGGRRADASAEAAARTLRAPEDKARIYFIRRGFVASLQGMNVSVDENFKGQIKSGKFVMAEVAPGAHRLNARMARGGKSTAAEMDFDLAPGESAFVVATIEMGALAASTKLTRVDETRARDELAGVKMMMWESAPAA